MKPLNLINVVIANRGLTVEQRSSLYRVWGISPKLGDLVALDSFVDQCESLQFHNSKLAIQILEDCFFGFVIPQISKEFDCLWIGNNTIVNLELKSHNIGEEGIKKQLKRNQYYLQHLKKTIRSFAYESSEKNCYSLDDNHNLKTVKYKDIAKAIFEIHQENLFVDDIETLFPPDQFLVSPFNSTAEFIRSNYFLTNQQYEFKNKIIQFVEDDTAGNFCAITGGPGSGKTLLLYDIARTLMESGKNVAIGHSGSLNSGHRILINNGWVIKSTKNLISVDWTTNSKKLVDADVYMIDEAQRCTNLDTIVEEVSKTSKKCVLSFDADQVMSNWEQKRDNAKKIRSLAGENCYALTSNIRTNSDVYSFVKALFDKHHSVNRDIHEHVEITYCQTIEEAIVMLSILNDKGFCVPRFTPRLYGRESYDFWFPTDSESAHEVIGQEFNNVAGLLSSTMYYNEGGQLVSCGNYYYREDRMLYQILTRARHKIHLVIVNNPTVLERCVKLINRSGW